MSTFCNDCETTCPNECHHHLNSDICTYTLDKIIYFQSSTLIDNKINCMPLNMPVVLRANPDGGNNLQYKLSNIDCNNDWKNIGNYLFIAPPNAYMSKRETHCKLKINFIEGAMVYILTNGVIKPIEAYTLLYAKNGMVYILSGNDNQKLCKFTRKNGFLDKNNCITQEGVDEINKILLNDINGLSTKSLTIQNV